MDQRIKVYVRAKNESYELPPQYENFQKVFKGPDQEEIFKEFEDVVNHLNQGYNISILHYGQSGSGKSYTSIGDNIYNSTRGILPRLLEILPNQLTISISEIYLEKETQLSNHSCSTYEETMLEIDESLKKRHTASTNLNDQSSRSHMIFDLDFEIVMASKILTPRLTIVDLAGSEKQKQSGTKELSFKQAIMINQSLTTLGRVFTALSANREHIPYRDSTLTYKLRNSLGGNSLTYLIANITGYNEHNVESSATLKYANNVTKITNTPFINEHITDINELNKQLKLYKSQLQNTNVKKLKFLQNRLVAQNQENSKIINEMYELISGLNEELLIEINKKNKIIKTLINFLL